MSRMLRTLENRCLFTDSGEHQDRTRGARFVHAKGIIMPDRTEATFTIHPATRNE